MYPRVSWMLATILALSGCLREPSIDVCDPTGTHPDCADGSVAPGADAGQPVDSAADGAPPDGETDTGASDAASLPADSALDASDSADAATGDAAPACLPGIERCNGADDDCDGVIDELAFTDPLDLGSAVTGGAHREVRVALGGEVAMVVWIEEVEGPDNLFGRTVNLVDGQMSPIYQYTEFAEEERGINGGLDLASDAGEGFVAVWGRTAVNAAGGGQSQIEAAILNPFASDAQIFFTHRTEDLPMAARIQFDEAAVRILYSGRNGLFSLHFTAGQVVLEVALWDTFVPQFSQVIRAVGSDVETYVAWQRTHQERYGVELARLSADGRVAAIRTVVDGFAVEPALVRAGSAIGLVWVALNEGSQAVMLDFMDPESLEGTLRTPLEVFSDPQRVVARPSAVGRTGVRDEATAVVVDWLASPRRFSPELDALGQHTMRAVVAEAVGGWRVAGVEAIRAGESNVIEVGLAGSRDVVASLSTDNGYGGPMCHPLCDSEIAGLCNEEATPAIRVGCRSECRQSSDGLAQPWIMACFDALMCDDADVHDTLAMCIQQIPPNMPPFETGVFLDVRRYCARGVVQ